MSDRLTVDTITSDQLDALYDRIAALESVAAGNKRHVQLIVPDLERAEAERDGAYRERAHLAAYLAALHPSHIGRTDPNAPDWPVLVVETPAGQMSWHIAERDLELFGHVRPTDRICRGWDRHTTELKYERLRVLTATAKPFNFGAFDKDGKAVCTCTYGARCSNCRD